MKDDSLFIFCVTLRKLVNSCYDKPFNRVQHFYIRQNETGKDQNFKYEVKTKKDLFRQLIHKKVHVVLV